MKVKRKLMFALTFFASSASSIAQFSCPSDADRLPLVCLVPDATIANTAAGKQFPGYSQALQSSLAINGAIGAQLTQLPLPTGTAGTLSLGGTAETPGRAYDNLGPVLIDQPGTIGKGRIYGGFSYQHFQFNALDGLDLKNIQFGYGVVSGNQAYYGSNSAKIDFKLDQYVGLITYGASKTTDVSIVVPFNSVAISTYASQFIAYQYDASTPMGKYLPPTVNTPVTVSGSATGIGDMSFGVKQLVYGANGSKLAVALGAGLRIPTGNDLNFLGSGAYGVNIYGLVSYRMPNKPHVSPHLKLGNVWNGPSPLLNPDGKTSTRLPGGVQYAVGFDAAPFKRLTLSADILGSQFTNGTVLSNSPANAIVLIPSPSTDSSYKIPTSLPVAQPVIRSYTTVDLSTGLKWKPYREHQLIVYGNVLIQLNNVGLRSYPVPLGGVSYSWGKNE